MNNPKSSRRRSLRCIVVQTPERPLIRGGGFGSGFCAGQVRSAPGRLAVCFLAPKAAYRASFVQKQVPCLDFVTAGRISVGERRLCPLFRFCGLPRSRSSGQCRQEGSPSPLARQGAARAWVRYTATTTVPGWLLVRSCKVGHMRGLIIYSQRSLFLLLPFYSVPTLWPFLVRATCVRGGLHSVLTCSGAR